MSRSKHMFDLLWEDKEESAHGSLMPFEFLGQL